MTNKEKLISYIGDRPTNITRDADTFLWARTSHYDEFARLGLGGGNLLIALGLFATLNYLGKIYYLLRGDRPFSGGEEAARVYRTLPREQRALFMPRRDGEMTKLKRSRNSSPMHPLPDSDLEKMT